MIDYLLILILLVCVAGACWSSEATYRRRRHTRCLANIKRLERELGFVKPVFDGWSKYDYLEDFDMRPGVVWPVESANYVQMQGVNPFLGLYPGKWRTEDYKPYQPSPL